jgi:hypothetical protein
MPDVGVIERKAERDVRIVHQPERHIPDMLAQIPRGQRTTSRKDIAEGFHQPHRAILPHGTLAAKPPQRVARYRRAPAG